VADALAPVVSSLPHRVLFPTGHSDLRVTWHEADGLLSVSLWRDDVCVASAPLSTRDAAELASFLVAHLGARAAAPHDAR
jgi:hypothetical protein